MCRCIIHLHKRMEGVAFLRKYLKLIHWILILSQINKHSRDSHKVIRMWKSVNTVAYQHISQLFEHYGHRATAQQNKLDGWIDMEIERLYRGRCLQLLYSRIQNLVWHANCPATRLLCTERKKGWIEQGKMEEIMHRGSNGKTEGERDPTQQRGETEQDMWRQAPEMGLRLSLRYSYVRETWRKLLAVSCLLICVHEREMPKKRKKADVCAYWSRAGRTSLYDSAAPVITD